MTLPASYQDTHGMADPAEAFAALGIPLRDLTWTLDQFARRRGPLIDSRRSGPELLVHLRDAFAAYPWLASVAGVARFSGRPRPWSETLEWSVGNHIFDDCPAAFGMSQDEGHILRGFTENYTEQFRALAQELFDPVPA